MSVFRFDPQVDPLIVRLGSKDGIFLRYQKVRTTVLILSGSIPQRPHLYQTRNDLFEMDHTYLVYA